jgi:AcrR family transcriptional regulator
VTISNLGFKYTLPRKEAFVKTPRKDAARTRRLLLAAASEIFAAKGFGNATVAEICRKAKANVAAVNYHFGSKGELYVEAWRYAFQKSLEKYPPDGGVPADAPVEERLRGRVRSIMLRISDPQDHEFEIVHKEMANPTGLLAGAMREAIEPIREGFSKIVREILGERADEQLVRLCQMSVKSQCFGPLLRERRRRMSPRAGHPPGEQLEVGVDKLADHVTRFSLAGIRELRREALHRGDTP